MTDCIYCGKPVRVETVQELTRYFKKVRKVHVYYCVNPDCDAIPYFYDENEVEVDGYDLKLEVERE